MAFDPLKYPVAYTEPLLLSDTSAWIGHMPVAWTLLDLAKPQQLVELGTHKGDSYCAFCQGVAQLKLPTHCTAVDTWRGDPHAGNYGQAILDQLRAHHDPLYGGFSTLLQTDFDSAATQFADGSVDLLHIDGLHTYDAVRHDYETWRPKMSERGIVLFHDTAARKAGFGVWKLWEELSTQFPDHFEFQHSSGLGVLGVGEALPPPVLEFFQSAREQPELMRQYFAALGHRLTLLRLGRYTLGALDWQRQQLDEWMRQHGTAPRTGPAPSASPYNAVRTLMDDFARVLRGDK